MVLKVTKKSAHRRFNNIFSVLVALLALYILLLPVLPYISLWVSKKTDKTDGYVYQTNLNTEPVVVENSKPIPKDNRLILPGIQLDQAILEGKDFRTIDKGIWRKPNSSTPGAGGNTVIVGHRFVYEGQAAFFHLDKIKVGDRFPLYWEGKEYDYEVADVKVVSPLAVEVEHNTDDPRLTIYTCTPLWTAKQRLVIVSKLITEATP